ncbi:MAG TPA: lipase family protein [Kofleriaceae bacterium]|jgi:pimeloyl-ACP methyl ester carboxylesterase
MRIIGMVAVVIAGCSSPSANGVEPDAAPDAPDAPGVDADLDAPTDVPAVPCTNTVEQVYAAAAQPSAALGTILACSVDDSLSVGDLPAMVGDGIEVTSAVKQYRIAYQTRDHAGAPAVSTARVYLPSTPRARPVPIVVAMHGSVGLADACVPSATIDHNLPLPFAARGFAVIAPDLAGLGNAGVQDYLDNHTQGWQTLDGARALRALLPTGITAQEMILAGYSQGGGAALSAQALFKSDGAGLGSLAATVVYAPEWPISMKSFDYETILRDPTALTIGEGLSYSSVAVLRQYAFFEDHLGAGRGKTSVASQYGDGLQSAVDSQCLVPLGGYIQTAMLHTGDLIESTLRTSLVACMDGTAGCTGDGAAYHQFLVDNVLAPDASAGPVFIVAGLLDQIMPPAKEGACIENKLKVANVDVADCMIATATHGNVMDQHKHGVAWAESVLAGGARYSCDAVVAMPACSN